MVVNISSSHNHGFYYFFFLLLQKSKKKFSAHEVQSIYYSLKGKLCSYWSTYIYTYILISLCQLNSSQLRHITKRSHSEVVLTRSFHLNSLILRNPNFPFQTNSFLFLNMAIHKFDELCSYAYLYGQKGFEQGSIQGYLGVWGEFQFHVELIRGQL